MSDVSVLIATRNRTELLVHRSLPSVMRQTHRPAVVVVVNDGPRIGRSERSRIHALARQSGVDVVVVPNIRTRGAGGAWNTGLEWLWHHGADGFVAILDDDDTWDPAHLEANISSSHDADISVSGLRMCYGGHVVERPLIDRLEARRFLTGNPGWQGSNTFVTLDLLMRVGGFREGLASLNDRDLAFRLLSHPMARWRLVPRWTATWHADTPGNLSTPRSIQKLEGLRSFWALYGSQMAPEEKRRFFRRARRVFGIAEQDIVSPDAQRPVLGFPEEQRVAK